ncbi:uncharacterized protein [Periplaneta americana]|uniref:uncharacterized protein n=1 Tax=Periplaneta americana TaxID=6978 RepID=UPI0037E87D13
MSYLTFVILVVACLPLRPAQGQAADRDVLSQGQESDITIIFSRRYKENDPSIQGTLECQYEKDLLVYRPHVPFYVAHNGTIYVGVYLAPNKTMVLFKQDQVEVEGHYLVFRDDKFHLIRNGSVTYVVYEPDSPNGKTIEKAKENSHPNPNRCEVLHPGTPDQEIMVPTEERNVDVKYEGHRYRSVFLPGMSRFIVYDPKQVTTRDGCLVFKGDKYKIIDKNMNLTFTLYGPPESASTVAMSTEGQHIQETLSTKSTTEGHSDNYTTKSMKKITHTHKTTIQNSQEKATPISSTQRKIPNPEVRTTHEAAIRGQKYTDTTIDRNTVTNRPTHATTTRQSHDHSIPKSSTKSRHTNSDTTQGYNTTYTMNAITRTHTTARQKHGKGTSKELTPESTLMPATHGHNTGHTSKNTHTTETEHHGNEINSSKPSTNSRHSNPESATTNEMPGHEHNTRHTTKHIHTTRSAHTTVHHGNESESSKPSTHSRHSNPESATTNEMPVTHTTEHTHTTRSAHTTQTFQS